MASEYLKWKYRNEKPAPPPRELSRKEKIRNFFDYYKWWLAAGAALLWILGSIVWNALGIGRIKPDYTAAYVGNGELTEDAVDLLRNALEALGEDVNGDGRVTVELRQYVTGRQGDPETVLGYNYAADTKLVADIAAGESYFFLTADPRSLQRAYHVYAMPDGSPPDDADDSASDKVFLWTGCPALRAAGELPAELEGLTVGRRCYYDEKTPSARLAAAALWEKLTEGAER